MRGWDRRNAYYFQLIQSLARHYGFDIGQPFERPAGARSASVLLHGSGERGDRVSTTSTARRQLPRAATRSRA
ncbi:MAG: hypothetical protein MZW92_41665 [Comamonadaceae bacterium]|nr:hypothetical protein [Comamonadaceae bacterium]